MLFDKTATQSGAETQYGLKYVINHLLYAGFEMFFFFLPQVVHSEESGVMK